MSTETIPAPIPVPKEKDPVCGMMVDPARAKATHEHAGKTYYFCCTGCKEKFTADPAKYLAPQAFVGIAPMSAPPIQIAPAPSMHSQSVATFAPPASSVKIAGVEP